MVDLNKIEYLLENFSDNDPVLFDAMYIYDEKYNSPKVELINSILYKSKNDEVVALAIDITRDKYGQGDIYWEYIKEIAEGVEWDVNEIARLSAINAFRFFEGDDLKLVGLVTAGINAANPIIRDAVAVLAQFKVNLSASNVNWGDGLGTLINEVPVAAKDWIRSISSLVD